MVGAAAAYTERDAVFDVAVPRLLVTTTLKIAPLSSIVVAGVSYVALVAPAMATPFLCHWKLRGEAPDAVTEKCAGWPTVTAALTGCAMIEGTVAVGNVCTTG